MNCGATSCPPIGVYSAEDLEEQLLTAMVSFSESNVTISIDKKNVLVFNLSRILQWYRKDYLNSLKSIPAMIYLWFLLGEEEDSIKDIVKYFDVAPEASDKMEMDKNGLMIWKKDRLEKMLTLKKGMKYKITWKKYDWGTNSK